MGLNQKERKELIREMKHKYKDKHGRWPKGLTVRDIRTDMGHSDGREIADINVEITREGQ